MWTSGGTSLLSLPPPANMTAQLPLTLVREHNWQAGGGVPVMGGLTQVSKEEGENCDTDMLYSST